MNIIEFGNYLNRPQHIAKKQTEDLENILKDFPYFQAAHFLYLNGLKNENSFKYNNELKITAAYTTDRAVMFDYITSSNFNKKIENSEEVSLDMVSLHEKNDNAKDEKVKKDESVVIKEEVPNNSKKLPIGKPFQFDVTENHSFNEWLQITTINPIIRDYEKGEVGQDSKIDIKKQSGSSMANFKLIEKFIASNPKIKPDKSFAFSNQEFDSSLENDNLMTETLAHVYLEQKKYDKAITAFTVLSLKYPEKNSFFANQIEAIKKLQEK